MEASHSKLGHCLIWYSEDFCNWINNAPSLSSDIAIKVSCSFEGRTSLRFATTLTNLVTVGIVMLKSFMTLLVEAPQAKSPPCHVGDIKYLIVM